MKLEICTSEDAPAAVCKRCQHRFAVLCATDTGSYGPDDHDHWPTANWLFEDDLKFCPVCGKEVCRS